MPATKTELAEQARILNIPGRSKMSKTELINAIAKCILAINKGMIYVKSCKRRQ